MHQVYDRHNDNITSSVYVIGRSFFNNQQHSDTDTDIETV